MSGTSDKTRLFDRQPLFRLRSQFYDVFIPIGCTKIKRFAIFRKNRVNILFLGNIVKKP